MNVADVSVMIQKMDKRALALRIFGKDKEDEGVLDDEEENVINSEDVEWTRVVSMLIRFIMYWNTPFANCDDRSKFRVTIIMPKKFGENTKKVAGNAKVQRP